MQPTYNIGAPVLVVPLTNRYNKNFLPMDANGEIPVSLQWFDASDITYQMVQPTMVSREVDAPVTSPRNPVLNVSDFMKGGGL